MTDEPLDERWIDPPQPNTVLISPFNAYGVSNLKIVVDAVIVFCLVLLGFEKVP